MRCVVLAVTLAMTVSIPARAELAVGEKAPLFTAKAARGGKEVSFSLTEALKRGTVILYFYPQGASETCYVENYEFSFVAERLQAAGITVVGVSSDRLANVVQTSLLECSDKLTLGSDPSSEIIRSYAAQNPQRPGYALSVGYVIASNGQISYASVNTANNAVEHVADMVRAAETLPN